MVIRAVDGTWKYESAPLYGELGRQYRPRRPHLRPRVVRVGVSREDPRFSSAVVEPRDVRGRRLGPAAVIVVEGLDVVAGPARTFPNACTAATPLGIRTLVCPDPWSLLGYARPRVRAQTAYTQRIPSPDLHAIDWGNVALPGGVCGSSHPIRPHDYGFGPVAFVHPDVDLRWWNPVWVYSWTRPVFGDLDGDGRDEAVLQVVCANGGGTAAGQLAFADVVFKATGNSLRVIGILRPQQPLDLNATHVPLSFVGAVRRGRVVVSEGWYGRYDGTCCASGKARTVWTYSRGRLRPRTTVLQKPWSSPLLIEDVVARPAARGLDDQRLTTIVATPELRFAVLINNEGQVTKRHVKVTLTIGQSPTPIVETRTIDRITPWQPNPATAVFSNLGRVQLRTKTAVTIEIGDRGTNPVRYPVIFTRG